MEEFKDEQVDETVHGICTYIDNYMYFNERSETNSGNDICGHCAKYYVVIKGCMQEDGCGESTVRI